MHDKRTPSDGYGEQSTPSAGRVRWQAEGSVTTHRGWLSDRSHTTLSFITGSHAQPSTGDRLVITGSSGSVRRYRVTRIASYDNRACLVACTARANDDDLNTPPEHQVERKQR